MKTTLGYINDLGEEIYAKYRKRHGLWELFKKQFHAWLVTTYSPPVVNNKVIPFSKIIFIYSDTQYTRLEVRIAKYPDSLFDPSATVYVDKFENYEKLMAKTKRKLSKILSKKLA